MKAIRINCLASAKVALAGLLLVGVVACAAQERVAPQREAQSAAAGPPSLWGEEIQLSRGNGGDADIAASGDTVHVVFGREPIWYRRSTDGGDTFSAPEVLVGGGSIHETDAIETDGQNVFVLYTTNFRYNADWCCQRELGDLYVVRSSDLGTHWESPFRITRSRSAFRQSIAVSDGTVHVVWSDFRTGVWELYYRSSSDGGVTWSPEQRLARAALEETNRPQIAASGDAISITWSDNGDGNDRCYTLPHCGEVYYIASSDRGRTWGQAARLTISPATQPLASLRPDIAVFSDGSLVIPYDFDLAFRGPGMQVVVRSGDGGRTWSPPHQLAGGSVAEQSHPAAAALGLVGAISWFDRRDPHNEEIYAVFSTDGGRVWGPEERVSFAPGESTTPHVAVTERYVHVTWLDSRAGGSEAFYRRRIAPNSPMTGRE